MTELMHDLQSIRIHATARLGLQTQRRGSDEKRQQKRRLALQLSDSWEQKNSSAIVIELMRPGNRALNVQHTLQS